jgi:hypothetical protein
MIQVSQSFSKTPSILNHVTAHPYCRFTVVLGLLFALEASGSLWKPLEASGSVWKPLEASGSLWKPLEASGSLWEPLVFFGEGRGGARPTPSSSPSRRQRGPDSLGGAYECAMLA